MSEPKPMPTYWSLAEEVTHLHGQLDQLEAENAKLRELAKHLYVCTRHNRCSACEYYGDACDFEYDLDELGIEVE